MCEEHKLYSRLWTPFDSSNTRLVWSNQSQSLWRVTKWMRVDDILINALLNNSNEKPISPWLLGRHTHTHTIVSNGLSCQSDNNNRSLDAFPAHYNIHLLSSFHAHSLWGGMWKLISYLDEIIPQIQMMELSKFIPAERGNSSQSCIMSFLLHGWKYEFRILPQKRVNRDYLFLRQNT